MRLNLGKNWRIGRAVAEPLLGFAGLAAVTTLAFGAGGLFPHALDSGAVWKISVYLILMTHITISAMSLCFHRQYTHQGVTFAKPLNYVMQTWLAMTTGMSKRDWVSIHIYHHAHSDQELDPHSPKQKGLWRIFFFGVYDYVVAKSLPDVVKLRKKIPEDRFEAVLNSNPIIGPILTVSLLTVLFGPLVGGLLSVATFFISPLFAVGGVNAIAHAFGYRNYETTDESRNIGFIFPLNWMIAGELDHNNHHAHPRSCSFRHRWYELDIGYVYIRLLSAAGLANVKTAHAVGSAPKSAPVRKVRSDPKLPNSPARPESLYA